MEIRQLRVVVALAEELHFGRTAQRMRLAQSAISQTIKTLEAELGVELFARTRRTVRLTAAGQRFVEGARRSLNELAATTASTQDAASGELGRLTVGLIAMASLTEIPDTIARFKRAYPLVTVGIESMTSPEQLDAIRAGRCDVGFVARATTKSGLDPLACRAVNRSPLVAIVPRRHRLATRKWIRIEELARDPFVFLSQAGEPRVNVMFRRRCIEAGFDPDIVLEVEHTDALLAFVAAGTGVSCAPQWIERLRFRGVVLIPMRPTFHAGLAAVWHPTLLAATARRFLEMLPELPGGHS